MEMKIVPQYDSLLVHVEFLLASSFSMCRVDLAPQEFVNL